MLFYLIAINERENREKTHKKKNILNLYWLCLLLFLTGELISTKSSSILSSFTVENGSVLLLLTFLHVDGSDVELSCDLVDGCLDGC